MSVVARSSLDDGKRGRVDQGHDLAALAYDPFRARTRDPRCLELLVDPDLPWRGKTEYFEVMYNVMSEDARLVVVPISTECQRQEAKRDI